MKKITLVLLGILFSSLSFSQGVRNAVKSELILKFKADKKPNSKDVETYQKFNISEINSLNERNNIQSIRLTGNKKQEDTYLLSFNPNQPIAELVALYQNTGLFEYVEPNYVGKAHGVQSTPNDVNFNRQWSHYNDGSFPLSNATNDADIDSELAWDITTGDPNLIVAILDTGAKLDHPEFSGRIWSNSDENQNGSDSDSNGYIDDINGWDFANNDNNPTDDQGHGTNVTGIALATGNNTIGYAGMNWNSKIMICKVLDSESFGYYSWWAEAIYYAVNNGASVINLSAGGNDPSYLLKDAIDYAYNNNVPVVVSSGNQNSVIQYPARYSNAFAIGSTNPDDTRSAPFFWNTTSGSNYGPELDFVAPGNYIYGLDYTSNTNYNSYWGGTSQAAPHVAGLISLLFSIKPNLSVDEIRLILEETSEDQIGNAEDTLGWDQYYGHGRINAFQALLHSLLDVNAYNNMNEEVLIYPNPKTSAQPLEIINLVDGEYTISVYNILGQNLYSKEKIVENSRIALLLPDLNYGTYFLRIEDKTKSTSTVKKLIIK